MRKPTYKVGEIVIVIDKVYTDSGMPTDEVARIAARILQAPDTKDHCYQVDGLHRQCRYLHYYEVELEPVTLEDMARTFAT